MAVFSKYLVIAIAITGIFTCNKLKSNDLIGQCVINIPFTFALSDKFALLNQLTIAQSSTISVTSSTIIGLPCQWNTFQRVPLSRILK